MRLLCVVTGNYGARIAAHLSGVAPSDWQVEVWKGPDDLPVVVDEPEFYVPDALPQADLLLSLAEHPGISDLAAELADRCGASAVIAPIDRWSWLSPGISRHLASRLKDRKLGYAFPSPFCSLSCRSKGHPLINAFAERFGNPELRCVVVNGAVVSWEILREAPCGSTRFVVDRLSGIEIGDVVEKAGLFHHFYPCLAGMENASVQSHTLLHQAAKLTSSSVYRALPSACRSGDRRK